MKRCCLAAVLWLGWWAATARPEELPPDTPAAVAVEESPGQVFPAVWGVVGVRGAVAGETVAPNGRKYDPLFTLDLDFNLMVLPRQRAYLYLDSRFWTERAAPGITHDEQGRLD